MQSQTHTFIINGSPMPCLQAGSGEPLLLIHGAGHDHGVWDAVAPGLASAGHRVIAPDLPARSGRRGVPHQA